MNRDKISKKEVDVEVELRIAVKTGKDGRGQVLDAKTLKARLEERKRLGLS